MNLTTLLNRRLAFNTLALVVVFSLVPLWLQVYHVWQDSVVINIDTAYADDSGHDMLHHESSLRLSGQDKTQIITMSPPMMMNKSEKRIAENIRTQIRQQSQIIDGVPDLDVYLPHLRGRHNVSVRPQLHWTQGRAGATLVIGIPTVQRDKAYYLEETLRSVISKLSPTEAQQCLIIVFIAEPWNASFVNRTAAYIKTRFTSEMASGLLEVMAPPAIFYPNLDKVYSALNDSKDRLRWRTKQSLDYAYLMLQAYKRAPFYLQLEDDVIAKENFFSFIMRHALSPQDWSVLKFSTLGFIGNLFHSSDLPSVLEFFLMFYSSKPVDWLLDNIMTTKYCANDQKFEDCLKKLRLVYRVVKPSQFQHIGYFSSLKGKIQKLKDKTFGKPKVAPPAKTVSSGNLDTNIGIWKHYTLERFWKGEEMFWGKTPKAGDYIDFCFKPSFRIHNYTIISKTLSRPTDRFGTNTTIEVLPKVIPKEFKDKAVVKSRKSICGNGTFYYLSRFNEEGETKLTAIPPGLQSIVGLRIHVTADMSHWVTLKSVMLNHK